MVSGLCLMASFCSGQGFTINTVAGDGVQGSLGITAWPSNAEIFAMAGLGVDGAGNIYIADSVNSRIRKVATKRHNHDGGWHRDSGLFGR